MLGPQSHLDHEVGLEPADFQPSSADEVAMACLPYSETTVRFSKCLERSRLQRVKRRCCRRTFHAHPLVEHIDSRRHQRIRTAGYFIARGDAPVIVNYARIDSFQTRFVNLSWKYMDLEIHIVAEHIEIAVG